MKDDYVYQEFLMIRFNFSGGTSVVQGVLNFLNMQRVAFFQFTSWQSSFNQGNFPDRMGGEVLEMVFSDILIMLLAN